MTKSKKEKLKDKLKARVAKLKNAQYERSGVIEKALIDFEKTLKGKVRNVGDYIALSAHQRRCLGIKEGQIVEHKGAADASIGVILMPPKTKDHEVEEIKEDEKGIRIVRKDGEKV